MADKRKPMPFEPDQNNKGKAAKKSQVQASSAIPRAVADRMARRVALFTGLPTLAGMGVFVGSYLVVTKGIVDIPPGLTLASSGFFFLLGLGGLSFGVLSASWDKDPGTLLGFENIRTNLSRLKGSLRQDRQSNQQ